MLIHFRLFSGKAWEAKKPKHMTYDPAFATLQLHELRTVYLAKTKGRIPCRHWKETKKRITPQRIHKHKNWEKNFSVSYDNTVFVKYAASIFIWNMAAPCFTAAISSTQMLRISLNNKRIAPKPFKTICYKTALMKQFQCHMTPSFSYILEALFFIFKRRLHFLEKNGDIRHWKAKSFHNTKRIIGFLVSLLHMYLSEYWILSKIMVCIIFAMKMFWCPVFFKKRNREHSLRRPYI